MYPNLCIANIEVDFTKLNEAKPLHTVIIIIYSAFFFKKLMNSCASFSLADFASGSS